MLTVLVARSLNSKCQHGPERAVFCPEDSLYVHLAGGPQDVSGTSFVQALIGLVKAVHP